MLSTLRNRQGTIASTVESAAPFSIEVDYEIFRSLPFCRLGIIITTADGTPVFEAYDADVPENVGARTAGRFVSICRIPRVFWLRAVYSFR